MDNVGEVIEVGRDGWELGEGRRRRQYLDCKEFALAEKMIWRHLNV